MLTAKMFISAIEIEIKIFEKLFVKGYLYPLTSDYLAMFKLRILKKSTFFLFENLLNECVP